MFERGNILGERLKALGVFSGIAVAAVSGFNLVITGGFDPLTPSFVSNARSEYDPQTVMRAWHYQPYVEASYEADPAQYVGYPAVSVMDADLAGGPDDPSAPAAPVMTSDDSTDDGNLYEEIERLYREPRRVVATSQTFDPPRTLERAHEPVPEHPQAAPIEPPAVEPVDAIEELPPDLMDELSPEIPEEPAPVDSAAIVSESAGPS